MEDTVCGYKNYETFTMAVDLANDQARYHEAKERTLEALNTCESPNVADAEVIAVAEALKAWQEDIMPEIDTDGPWSSLLEAGWQGIDWYEIAVEWIDNVAHMREVQA